MNESTVWKGGVAGAVGGLAGAWAMNQFQSLWSKIGKQLESGDNAPNSDADAFEESSTVKTAQMIAHAVLHRDLSKDEKKVAGPVVHYAFGASIGAAYGALVEFAPAARTWAGLPFGTAVWLGGDEVMVPALGLSKAADQYPLSTHVNALASHLVYAATAEGVRRLARAAL